MPQERWREAPGFGKTTTFNATPMQADAEKLRSCSSMARKGLNSQKSVARFSALTASDWPLPPSAKKSGGWSVMEWKDRRLKTLERPCSASVACVWLIPPSPQNNGRWSTDPAPDRNVWRLVYP